jgi:transcriptional regulator with XRE-family HTH domain
MQGQVRPIGEHLRLWRQRRRMSQLELAAEAGISARHLSFIETGRAAPSREVVLRLAEPLGLPLRERNVLLLAAGYAPAYPQRPLDDPAFAEARAGIEALLRAHEPFPALAIDRHWTLVAANRAVAPLLTGVAPALLQPPVNVLRLSLRPDGLAPRILNLPEWRAHLLARLRREVEMTADVRLIALLREFRDAPEAAPPAAGAGQHGAELAIPLRLVTPAGVLSLLSTSMVFGTPLDVTLSELAIETFLPADSASVAALRRLVPEAPPQRRPSAA